MTIARWMGDAAQDVRYAIRALRRSPHFAIVSVLTLAVGIGATTAIYSVVDTILLRPLSFADADRLVRVVENAPPFAAGRPISQRGIAYPEFLDWRGRAKTLTDATAIIGMSQRMVRTPQGAAGLWGAMVSPHTFRLLGVRPLLGRTLESASGPDEVVLSFDTWTRHFASDPSIVGRALEFRAGALLGPTPPRLLTVTGVLPADFEFPTGTLDFFTPILLDPARRPPGVTMLARLAPGATLESAVGEVNTMGAAIRPPWPREAPALTGPRFEVQRLKDQAIERVRPALRVLLVAVVVVLLIVCANVANLVLARGTARQREMAVRAAIGASRGRLVRQIMSECLVLAAAGGTLGTACGAAGIALVKQLATIEAPGVFRFTFGSTILPRAHEVAVDLQVPIIAFAIATVAMLVFGALPALHLSNTDAVRDRGSRGGGAGRRESRMRAALAVAQLVMATVLLVGAGLLAHSFLKLTTMSRGYNPDNVLAFNLLFPDQYSIARKAETIETLLARLRAMPDVQSAGFSRHGLLITEELTIGTFVPPGLTLDAMRFQRSRVRSISDGFLSATGIPLLAGREFEASDGPGAPPVIVMNRSAARRYFGEASPLGRVVDWHVGSGHAQMTVVGVVEDVRQQSATAEVYPEIYVEYRQFLSLLTALNETVQRQNEMAIGFLSFALMTRNDPMRSIAAVGNVVRAVDPNVGIDGILPMERLVASSVARPRFYAVIVGVFAGVAALLAAIGVYGVLAYAVSQRTHEIGIRMALGAQRAQVLGLVLRTGLILTAVGVAGGLAAAAAATRMLEGMLFGITPLDPATFVAVAILFSVVAMAASYVPARRATKVDPMVALRHE